MMEVDGNDDDDENDVVMIDDMRRKRNRLNTAVEGNHFIELENAFKGNLKTYYLKNTNQSVKDICMLLVLHSNEMEYILRKCINVFGAVKFNILVECTYIKPNTRERQDRAFKTKNIAVFIESNLNSILHNLFNKICKEESNYEGQGSGWSLLRVDGIMLRINRFTPLGGSTFIPLPDSIKQKHAVVNPVSHDNYCFKWAILCKFVTGAHRDRVDYRFHAVCNRLNFDGIDFPTPLKNNLKKRIVM